MPVLDCQPVRRALSMSRCSRGQHRARPARGRARAAGVQGGTRSRKSVSAAQMVPTPARLRWSSRASPTNRRGAVTRRRPRPRRPSRGRARRGRGGRRGRPRARSARGRACRAAARAPSSRRCSDERPAVWRRCVATGRAARRRSTRHWPSIRRWVCRVSAACRYAVQQVLAARDDLERCATRRGRRSAHRGPAQSARSTTRPAQGRRRGGRRCGSTVSPSGTADHLRIRSPRGVRWKPASSRAARSGWPGAEQLAAVGLLDGDPARGCRGGRRRPARRPPARSRSGSSDQVSRVLPPRST